MLLQQHRQSQVRLRFFKTIPICAVEIFMESVFTGPRQLGYDDSGWSRLFLSFEEIIKTKKIKKIETYRLIVNENVVEAG